MRTARYAMLLVMLMALGPAVPAKAVPPEDESDPLPVDVTTPAEMRAYVFKYLEKKFDGLAPVVNLPRDEIARFCRQQYADALKARGPRALHGWLHSNLKEAERRLQSGDEEVRRSGGHIADEAARCAAVQLKDIWLAAHIREAFDEPLNETMRDRREEADRQLLRARETGKLSHEAFERKRTIAAWDRTLLTATSWSRDAVEEVRARLATALENDGQLEAALKVLEGMDPKGALSDQRAKRIDRVKAKLEK